MASARRGLGRRMALTVNVSGVEAAVRAATLSDADVTRLLRTVQIAALNFWKTTAQRDLKSTSRDYVQALSLGKSEDPKSFTIVLASSNPIVDMVENGWKGGDMRAWMLKSKKAKTRANGTRVLVIPFRHGAPSSSGRNTGPTMPQAIAQAASKLLATMSKPATESGPGGTAWVKGPRGRLGMDSRGVKTGKEAFGPRTEKKAAAAEAREILSSKQKEWHSTSIYTGMIRKGQPTKTGVQTSGFTTFRTISSKPGKDPRSWFHPGIRPRRLAVKTQGFILKTTTAIVADLIQRKSGAKK